MIWLIRNNKNLIDKNIYIYKINKYNINLWKKKKGKRMKIDILVR